MHSSVLKRKHSFQFNPSEEDSYETEDIDEVPPRPLKKAAPDTTYGFRPMEGDAEASSPEVPKVLSERAKRLKLQINQIILQYPQLQIRCSSELLKKLDQYSEEDLYNIHMNAINDVTTIRGTPSAECFLIPTKLVDPYLPTYSEVCKKDEPLKRDIELLWMEYVGYLGTIGNIAFSLIRNMNTAYEENIKNEQARFLAGLLPQPFTNGELRSETQVVIDGIPVPGREPPGEAKVGK